MASRANRLFELLFNSIRNKCFKVKLTRLIFVKELILISTI